MKKLMIAAVAMAAMTVVSCQKGVKTDLKTDVDTLAYELGVYQGEGLKQYMQMQLGVDSAYLDDFIKGMQEGAMNELKPDRDAYLKGIQVGMQVRDMSKGLSSQVYMEDSTKSISPSNILAGLVAVLKGESKETSQEAFQKFNTMMDPIQTRNMEAQYGDNKKAGEKYLAENAKKPGVQKLDGGVQYKVLKEGAGALPTDSTKVEVAYVGRLIDGTVFDSSRVDNPFIVDLAMPRVIPGWVTALKKMPLGSKWEVTIPQDQAYGKQNMGMIKPFSTLVFEIEVKAFK